MIFIKKETGYAREFTEDNYQIDATTQQAEKLYSQLTDKGVTVLYDDRDVRAGQKFADADLLGIPYRVVVSDKTRAAGTFEFKARQNDQSDQINENELLKLLQVTLQKKLK